MHNILTAPEETTAALYVQGIRNILASAHVRNTHADGQRLVGARIWNGTIGFSTGMVLMDRAKLDSFQVRECIEAVVNAACKQSPLLKLIDCGVVPAQPDPLGGHNPSEWGVAETDPYKLRTLILSRAAGIGCSQTVREQLYSCPEAISLGEEMHARLLAEVSDIRAVFVKNTFLSMLGTLRLLVAEGVSTENIQEGVGRMVRSLQKTAQEPAPLQSWSEQWTALEESQRSVFMAKIRREATDGLFCPVEWLWCFDEGGHVLNKADGVIQKLPFTADDIAFIREFCSPVEVDRETLHQEETGR